MKRSGKLWGEIISPENIALAHKQARRGKAFYTEVKMVDADPERYLGEIQRLLAEKRFSTSPYEIEKRFDGRKLRTIYKLPYYPDRIVQHALLNVIGPIIERSLIRDTFQSIRGRGTSDAARRVKALVRWEDAPRYALKVDVQKYYPSVNNDVLKAVLRRKIKCEGTLWLIDDIIDSTQGLPIGNYTSQHFGNIYLSGFDWWMKQQVKPRGYFRYCDDILVFGNSPAELLAVKGQMVERLAELRLTVKPTWTVYDVRAQGVDFVGYVFKPESTRLRRNIAKSFKRACRTLTKACRNTGSELSSLMAYKGWCKPASAKRLWRDNLTPRLLSTFPQQLRGAL